MISKEKMDIIRGFCNDDSDLIEKIIKYLETTYKYIDTDNIFSNFQEAKNFLSEIKESNAVMFCLSKQNKIDGTIEIKESNFKIYGSENAIYAGKEYENKVVSILETVKDYDRYLVDKEKIKIVIDISSISRYPLWYTMMRRKMLGIIEKINTVRIEELTKKFLHSTIIEASIAKYDFNLANEYDIDFVINIIRHFAEIKPTEVIFIDSEKNQDSIYLVNEIKKFIYAVSVDKIARCEYIYDTVCKDLDEMFSIYGFCNFKNNMCVAQRHKSLFMRYPVPKTDGCCFKVIRKCEHNNKDGTCKVKCLPCKLFTCPYLGKIQIGMRASENILLRSFFNNKQKRISIYEFYTSKEILLKKICKVEEEKEKNNKS